METITVTEAQRNFSELIDYVHSNRESAILLRGKTVVARIVPARKHSTGATLLKCLNAAPRLSPEESRAFADDIEQGRKQLNKPPLTPWRKQPVV
jgi:antitoxin (DNA-binding transcriptional repressor) of toxin-antitoxin stability system